MNRILTLLLAALLAVTFAQAADAKDVPKNGTVLVEFVVGKDGKPTKIKIIESTHKAFNASVLEAVAKWKFDPKLAGTKMRQPVEFRDEAVPPKDNRPDAAPSPPPKVSPGG